MGQVTGVVLLIGLMFGGTALAEKKAGYRRLTPTLYYVPVYDLDKPYKCEKGDRKNTLRDPDLKPVIVMCRKDYRNCMMQGSCVVIKKGEQKMLHYSGIKVWSEKKKEPLFKLEELGECPFGRGPGNVCLEPFFSVAADPQYHKSGDVLYVPALKGLTLPNGQIHDGFIVVRDQGGRINGPNRFDFFTGFHKHDSDANPFVDLKLADMDTNLNYLKIPNGRMKNEILNRRGYPGLPE